MPITRTPLVGFPWDGTPFTHITPFTHRDGLTYLRKLEMLQAWLYEQLVPWINTSLDEYDEVFKAEISALVAKVNEELNETITNVNTALANQTADNDTKITTALASVATSVTNLTNFVNTTITAQTEYVDNKVETFETHFNETVEMFLQNSLESNDPMVSLMVENADSDTRTSLDKFFQPRGTGQTNVLSLGLTPSENDQADKINAVLALGIPLFFPAGTYRSSKNLLVKSSIYGIPGKSKFSLDTNGLNNSIRLTADGSTDVTIDGIYITETGVTARSGSYGLIAASDAVNLTVQNCITDGGSSTGMHFIRCNGLKIHNNVVKNSYADGIHVQRGSKNIRITSNYVYNNGDDGIGLVSHGFNDAGYVTDAVVEGNIIGPQRAGSPGSGIAIIGVIGTVVSGNRISGSALSGIRITAYFNVSEGNAIGGNHVISDNVITDVGLYTGSASGVVRDGISCYSQRNVKISGNIIDKTVATGIALADAGIEIDISSNKITRTGADGISISPLSRNGDYLKLWTEPLLTDGLSLDYVHMHQIHVVNNYLRVVGGNGIRCNATNTRYINGLTIRGNEVWYANSRKTASGISGISLSYGINCIIRENFVSEGYDGAALGRYSLSNLLESANNDNLPASFGQRTLMGTAQHFQAGASPTGGTYTRGDTVWNTSVGVNARAFWTCSQTGTFGQLNLGNTIATTEIGSTKITVNSNSGLVGGAYITIAGVTGMKKVMEVVGNIITLDVACDATVTDAAVAYSPCVFVAGPSFT